MISKSKVLGPQCCSLTLLTATSSNIKRESTRLKSTSLSIRSKFKELASHGATMVLFLSTGLLAKVTQELIAGGYAPDAPAAIVYKASWPDEKVFRCTVATLEETAKANNITKTALITVGGFLNSDFARSHLYHPDFPTEYREVTK